MLERFRNWYLTNQIEITWFLIGFLIMSALVDFGRGNFIGMTISLAIAYINYLFVKKK